MKSITGLKCSTGEDWISWPVGTTAPAIEQVDKHWAGNIEAVSNITAAVATDDERMAEMGAVMAALWVPVELGGLVVGQLWAGLDKQSSMTMRSALRFKRSIEERQQADATVFSQNVMDFVADDVDATALVEQCADDSGRPSVRFTAAYFPTWTTDRAILRGVCFVPSLATQFVATASRVAASLTFISNDE